MSLIERGRKVYRIPEKLFSYRVASDSMVRSREKWQKLEMFKRIYQHHQPLFSENIEVWIDALLDSQDVYYTSRLYIDKGTGLGDEWSVGRKVEQGTRIITFDLTNYRDITSLRFDPVDTFAVVELEQIVIRYNSGKELSVDRIQCNELYSHDGKMFFDTADPQCHFPGLGPLELVGIVEFSVTLRFVALADSALKHLVDYQKELIDGLRDQKLSRKIGRAGKILVNTVPGQTRVNRNS